MRPFRRMFLAIVCGASASLMSCTSFPAGLRDVPAKTSLVSVALDRSVTFLGQAAAPVGILVDREAYNRPFDAGVEVWTQTVIEGWQALYPNSVGWFVDPEARSGYQSRTSVAAAESLFGFDQPDAVRFGVAKDWNYISARETAKIQALAQFNGAEALWVLESQALYMLDAGRASDSQYHLEVRTNVALISSNGSILAQTDIRSYSDTHSYQSTAAARRELSVTLAEAATDFLRRWKAAAF